MRSGARVRHRRSIRLAGYDYAGPGACFVTICTHGRACLFGDVAGGVTRLNAAGRVAEECWRAIPDHFPHVALDAFVVMPNHVHGILWIVDAADAVVVGADPVGDNAVNTVGAKNLSPLPLPRHVTTPSTSPAVTPVPPTFRSPSKTIGSVVRGFKIGVTKWMRTNTDVHDVWQRNYYEHIIRDEVALRRIRHYIGENPARWSDEAENPARHSHNAGDQA